MFHECGSMIFRHLRFLRWLKMEFERYLDTAINVIEPKRGVVVLSNALNSPCGFQVRLDLLIDFFDDRDVLEFGGL
jgi:hypothetical protein